MSGLGSINYPLFLLFYLFIYFFLCCSSPSLCYIDFLFLWLIFDFVSVGGCVSEEERRWQGRQCIGFADGEKRKKEKRSEIRNY